MQVLNKTGFLLCKNNVFMEKTLWKNYTIYNNQSEMIKKDFKKLFLELTQGNKSGLIISGSVGVGKTYLACSLIDGILRQRNVMEINEKQEITAYYSEYNKIKITTPIEITDIHFNIRDYMHYDYIFLDDMGISRNTEYVNEKLFDFIDTCINSKIKLIITTNIPKKFFEYEKVKDYDLMQKRIFSRLNQLDIYTLKGKDMRFKN